MANVIFIIYEKKYKIKQEISSDILARVPNVVLDDIEIIESPDDHSKIVSVSYTVKKGKTVNLKATISPKNATNKEVTYKSSNKRIAASTLSVIFRPFFINLQS